MISQIAGKAFAWTGIAIVLTGLVIMYVGSKIGGDVSTDSVIEKVFNIPID